MPAGLQPAILATLGAPWLELVGFVMGVAAPVAFALGLPFPLGLSRLDAAPGHCPGPGG